MPCMVSSMRLGLILLLLTDICLGKSKDSHNVDKKRGPRRQNQVRGEISVPEESGEPNGKNLDINVYLPKKIMTAYQDDSEKAGTTDKMTNNAPSSETSSSLNNPQQQILSPQNSADMNSQATMLPSPSPLLLQPVIQPLIDLSQANRAQSWPHPSPPISSPSPAPPSIFSPGTPPNSPFLPSFIPIPVPVGNQAGPPTSLIFASAPPPPPIVQAPALPPAPMFPFPVPSGQSQTVDTRSSTEPFTMSMINELSRALERQQMSGEMTSMSHAISETMLHALMLGHGLANDHPHDTVRDTHEIHEIRTDHRDRDYHDNGYQENNGERDQDYQYHNRYHDRSVHYDPQLLYDDIRHAVFAARDEHADESERKIIHSLKNAFRDVVEEMKEKEPPPDRSKRPKSNDDNDDDDDEDDSSKRKKRKRKRRTHGKTKSQDVLPEVQGLKPSQQQVLQIPPAVEQLTAPTGPIQPLSQTIPAIVQSVPEPAQTIQTVQAMPQTMAPVVQPITENLITQQPPLSLPVVNSGTPTGSVVLEPAAAPMVAQPQTIYQPLAAQPSLGGQGALAQAPVPVLAGNQLPVSEGQPLALPVSSSSNNNGKEGAVEETLPKEERRRRRRKRRKWNRLLQGEESDTRAYFHKQGNYHNLDHDEDDDSDKNDDKGGLDSETNLSDSEADMENYRYSIRDKAIKNSRNRETSTDSASVVDLIPPEFLEAAEKPLKSAGVKLNELDTNKKYEVLGKILAKAMEKAQKRLKEKVKKRHKYKGASDKQNGEHRSDRRSTKLRHIASDDGDEDTNFDFVPANPYFSIPS